ncbi:MAG: hypothetical protein AAGB31_02040 [Bdellovibrio sp.]
MSTLRFLFLLGTSFWLFSCAHQERQIPRDIASLQSNGGMEGIWFLQGTSSVRGPYNGELELRKSHDGTFNVVRVITYINYFFDGLKVQEVWTGKAVAESRTLTITYDLQKGDFITRLGGERREADDIGGMINVVSRFNGSSAGLTTKFDDGKISNYSEWVTTKRPLETQPMWKSERLASGGGGKGKHMQPLVVHDPTDLSFYRQSKDTIRVINKVVDNISITESVFKRNAYAPTLYEKAQAYDRDMEKLHIDPAGVVTRALPNENRTSAQHIFDKDSPLWTGLYIQSQAWRYRVTREAQALQNVRKSLNGLRSFLKMQEDVAHPMIRTLAAYKPSLMTEEDFHGIAQGLIGAASVIPRQDTGAWEELQQQSRLLLRVPLVESQPYLRTMAWGIAAWVNQDISLKNLYLREVAALRPSANPPIFGYLSEIFIAQGLGAESVQKSAEARLIKGFNEKSFSQSLIALARSKSVPAAAVEKAVWDLRELPYPRPELNVSISRPSGPNEPPTEYPIYESVAYSSGFVWREPLFMTELRHTKGAEVPGVDYLYAYWLARASGVSPLD